MANIEESEYEQGLAAVGKLLASGTKVTNRNVRFETELTYDQAITFFNRAIAEGKLKRVGRAGSTHYIRP